MKFKFPDDREEIRNSIKKNFAQKSSSNDRMLDLDSEISIFGNEIEQRNEFARDRDRIIYSTAFRRLEHKAQVYSHEKGDHYRTRLTHTLEVTQIARGIARNLGLNEDLTEAIALGHDIGHTPFGHAGEEILDRIMRGEDDLGGKFKYKIDYGGFKHNFNSLKILDIIERKYEDQKGLNLTWQVLEGILKHTKIKKGNKKWDWHRFVKSENFFKPFIPYEYFKDPLNYIDSNKYPILESSLLNLKHMDLNNSFTLEGQVVNIADEIAQRQHDLDDGLRDVELQMKESDVLKHISGIIEKIIDEVVQEKILDLTDPDKSANNIRLKPLNSSLTKLREIIKEMDMETTSELNKKLLLKIYSILNDSYDSLDEELQLLISLRDQILNNKLKEDSFKWKTMIRDVISYFIHDVTLNTMEKIRNKEYIFYKDNGYLKKENERYLLKNMKNNSLLNEEYLINKRNYFISPDTLSPQDTPSQVVCLSNTADRLDKKIHQYIENRIINSYNVNRFDGKAKFIIRQLFKAYYENPKQMSKSQLDYLSNLINDNLDNYYDLEFIGDNKEVNNKVRDIKFDSKDPEFILDLKDVSKLIKLLKLEIKLEDLNSPDIKLDLNFIKEINGRMYEISKKWGHVDENGIKLIIFNEILRKINLMDKSEIMEENDEIKRKKILFIKCLLENHYAYLSVICDYIAGMTDNYAKKEYEKLYLV